jgi:hypothetical protein
MRPYTRIAGGTGILVGPASETVPEFFMNPTSCHDFPSPSPSPIGRGNSKSGSPCLPLPPGEGRGEGEVNPAHADRATIPA